MVKRLQRPESSNLRDITSIPSDENIDQMERDILSFFQSNKLTDSMYKRRAKFVNMISDYLKTPGIVNQLESEGIVINVLSAFGSFATHCATKDSDLDLCVCAKSEVKGALAVTVLQAINRDLQHNPQARKHFGHHTISEINFVQTAKVPIIRFKLDDVSVDLSATLDDIPPRTSLAAKYINAHCQLDRRFPVLVIFLKMWMKSEGNAEDHLREYPNSYSIILMLIHVLQWYNVIPNLHVTHKELFNMKNFSEWEMVELDEKFKFPLDENTVTVHNARRTSRWSVVQLLKLFAFHYSNESMLNVCRFNMKSGEIEERPNAFRQDHSISILDPYDKRNPARSARNAENFIGSLKELLILIERPDRNLFLRSWRITQEKLYLINNPVFQPLPPPLTPFNMLPVTPARIYGQNFHYHHFPGHNERFFPMSSNYYTPPVGFPLQPYGVHPSQMFYQADPRMSDQRQSTQPNYQFFPRPNQYF